MSSQPKAGRGQEHRPSYEGEYRERDRGREAESWSRYPSLFLPPSRDRREVPRSSHSSMLHMEVGFSGR